MTTYTFPNHSEFLNRREELERLRHWWEDDRDPFPILLYGRRRTGKSWLLREFANGQNADIFVCDTRAPADQLAQFASTVEPATGFRPQFEDLGSFYRLLFRQAQSERRFAVIDEFPLLCPAGSNADSVLASVMEQQMGNSRLKLVLCGSQISSMKSLLAERAALHGRATPLTLRPLGFDQAVGFLSGHRPAEMVARYSIAGGMPLYLRLLGGGDSLRTIVCNEVLNPLGPLFDEVRELLAMELTSAPIHFSLLSALSGSPSLAWDELVAKSRVDEATASRYISLLEDLGLVEAANPPLAPLNARRRRYRVADPFIRFWFRFVFPYQSDLAAGLRPQDHFDRNIAPFLPDHVAPSYEDICRWWVRSQYPEIDSVAAWWGLSRHDLRRRKIRSSEEIDVVGVAGRKVLVVGECRWQNKPMSSDVLGDLVDYKLPALAQAGADVSDASIVLFSRGGFGKGLTAQALRRPGVRLVQLPELLKIA